MNKLMAVLLSGCTLLLLGGCPKPGGNGNPPDGKVCGGLQGILCPEGQYCHYAVDAGCGFADAGGICQSKPDMCTMEYHPVCGCDGQTYGNACSAAQAGVSVKHDGRCEQLCGGIANIQCPSELTCVDNPDDNCNPATGGADCSGVCVKR